MSGEINKMEKVEVLDKKGLVPLHLLNCLIKLIDIHPEILMFGSFEATQAELTNLKQQLDTHTIFQIVRYFNDFIGVSDFRLGFDDFASGLLEVSIDDLQISENPKKEELEYLAHVSKIIHFYKENKPKNQDGPKWLLIDALNVIEKGISEFPNCIELYDGKSKLLINLEDPSAIAQFSKEMKSKLESNFEFYSIRSTLPNKALSESVLNDYKFKFYNNLMGSYLQLHNPARALEACKYIVDELGIESKEGINYANFRMKLLYNLEKYDEIIEILKNSVKTHPEIFRYINVDITYSNNIVDFNKKLEFKNKLVINLDLLIQMVQILYFKQLDKESEALQNIPKLYQVLNQLNLLEEGFNNLGSEENEDSKYKLNQLKFLLAFCFLNVGLSKEALGLYDGMKYDFNQVKLPNLNGETWHLRNESLLPVFVNLLSNPREDVANLIILAKACCYIDLGDICWEDLIVDFINNLKNDRKFYEQIVKMNQNDPKKAQEKIEILKNMYEDLLMTKPEPQKENEFSYISKEILYLFKQWVISNLIDIMPIMY